MAVTLVWAQDAPSLEFGPPPTMPLHKALGADGDSGIDAAEIGNAAATLAKLDKHGAGQKLCLEGAAPKPKYNRSCER